MNEVEVKVDEDKFLKYIFRLIIMLFKEFQKPEESFFASAVLSGLQKQTKISLDTLEAMMGVVGVYMHNNETEKLLQFTKSGANIRDLLELDLKDRMKNETLSSK